MNSHPVSLHAGELINLIIYCWITFMAARSAHLDLRSLLYWPVEANLESMVSLTAALANSLASSKAKS